MFSASSIWGKSRLTLSRTSTFSLPNRRAIRSIRTASARLSTLINRIPLFIASSSSYSVLPGPVKIILLAAQNFLAASNSLADTISIPVRKSSLQTQSSTALWGVLSSRNKASSGRAKTSAACVYCCKRSPNRKNTPLDFYISCPWHMLHA